MISMLSSSVRKSYTVPKQASKFRTGSIQEQIVEEAPELDDLEHEVAEDYVSQLMAKVLKQPVTAGPLDMVEIIAPTRQRAGTSRISGLPGSAI